MDTVTRPPRYGSIDYYARLLRPQADEMLNDEMLNGVTLHLVDDLANDPIHELDAGDGSRLDRIRNLLAAAELVRAERAGR